MPTGGRGEGGSQDRIKQHGERDLERDAESNGPGVMLKSNACAPTRAREREWERERK